MGEGLKRVAAQCGGLSVTAKGETVHYDAQGKVREPKTIAQAIEEYNTTPKSAKKLIHRLLDKLMNLTCPHCGKSIPVEIGDEKP